MFKTIRFKEVQEMDVKSCGFPLQWSLAHVRVESRVAHFKQKFTEEVKPAKRLDFY